MWYPDGIHKSKPVTVCSCQGPCHIIIVAYHSSLPFWLVSQAYILKCTRLFTTCLSYAITWSRGSRHCFRLDSHWSSGICSLVQIENVIRCLLLIIWTFQCIAMFSNWNTGWAFLFTSVEACSTKPKCGCAPYNGITTASCKICSFCAPVYSSQPLVNCKFMIHFVDVLKISDGPKDKWWDKVKHYTYSPFVCGHIVGGCSRELQYFYSSTIRTSPILHSLVPSSYSLLCYLAFYQEKRTWNAFHLPKY